MKKFKTAIWVILFGYTQVVANDIQIANIDLVDGDPVNDFIFVEFDLSWDNSWRYDGGNWDAAWVFVKFRTGAEWRHATLYTTGHSAPLGVTIDTPSDGKGVFIYRSSPGSGSNSWQDVRLKWNYGADGVADDDVVAVRVFAIEMVYVPQGSFYVGDMDADVYHCFYEYGGGGDGDYSYHITSEGEINIGTTAGYLYFYGAPSSAVLSADFPKGYNAFYCMKYEMSQAQYRDFLNTLTSSQASNRFLNAFGGNRHGITTTGGDPPYGCNLDGDDIFDEANDGEWIACNYISWEDGSAYADWAALRPMTEFEYEKACRGNQGVVDDEYAWGTTSYTIASGLINPGTENETVSNSGEGLVNCESSYPDGPFRCGFAATASTNRAGAGAGYWGIMELSGNLSEWVVSVQDSEGRSFTGVHGDGELSASGYANVENWPDRVGSNGRGYGRRGGYWSVGIGVIPHFFCVAGRPYGVWDVEASLRDRNVTIRCVRTAP